MILNNTQRAILIRLHESPKCPGDIAKEMDVEKSLISHSLNSMKDLVTFTRSGKNKTFELTAFGKSTYLLLKTHDLSFQDLFREYHKKRK